ncbi:unnamed protein product, partial [Prorocentrum cordatum]
MPLIGMALAGLLDGDFYFVRYGVPGPPLFHERRCVHLPLIQAGGVSASCTTDDDHYDEDHSPGGDVVERCFLPGGARGEAPPAVVGGGGARVCRFRGAPLVATLGASRDAAAVRAGHLAPGLPLAPYVGGVGSGLVAFAVLGPGWPVRRPRTRVWICQFMPAGGGRPVARHHRCKTDCRLSDEGGVVEHLRICTALENAIWFDQIYVTEMASFELLGRALQVLEERYCDRLAGFSDPSRVDTHRHRGIELACDSCGACPTLQDWVSQELAEEHATLKDRRATREERAAAATAKAKAKARGRQGGPRPGFANPTLLFMAMHGFLVLLGLPRSDSATSSRCRRWGAERAPWLLGVSAVARRRAGASKTVDWANACIDSLNSAYGHAKHEQPQRPMNASQRAALDHIESGFLQ